MFLPKTPSEWNEAFASLPSTPEKIPAFFFGHGSPILAMNEVNSRSSFGAARGDMHGELRAFLRAFGPMLLDKYKPKAILVVSAHWETYGEQLGVLYFFSSVSCVPSSLTISRISSHGLRR